MRKKKVGMNDSIEEGEAGSRKEGCQRIRKDGLHGGTEKL